MSFQTYMICFLSQKTDILKTVFHALFHATTMESVKKMQKNYKLSAFQSLFTENLDILL